MKFLINDCSYEKLVNLCIKCGFKTFEGKKHIKVKNNKDQFITTIPRHRRLKKPLIEDVVKSLVNAGADIDYQQKTGVPPSFVVRQCY